MLKKPCFIFGFLVLLGLLLLCMFACKMDTDENGLPEIAIFAGNKEYFDDGSSYNFSPQIVGTPVTTKITIKNIGESAFSISDTVLSDTSNFKLISTPPSSIAVGKEGTFSVKFNPTSAGTFDAYILLKKNAQEEDPFKLHISGVSKNTVSEYDINIKYERGTLPSGSGAIVYVCWIEDEDDNFVQNIFICNKLIKGGLTGTANPNWKTTTYPLDIDAVSSATQKNSLDYTTGLKDPSKKFRVYFEVDHSWNGNDYFNDRPSFIYRTDLIDINNLESKYELDIFGWMSNEARGTGSLSQEPKVSISGYEEFKLMSGSLNLTYIEDYLYMKKTLEVSVLQP